MYKTMPQRVPARARTRPRRLDPVPSIAFPDMVYIIRTAAVWPWISRDEMAALALYLASLDDTPAMRPKTSLTNELMMRMALDEMPVSGWTCFSTW